MTRPGRRFAGAVPHPTRADWLALVDLSPYWLEGVHWILRQVLAGKRPGTRAMVREIHVKPQLAGQLMRSAWVGWARAVIGVAAPVEASTEKVSGNSREASEAPANQALARLRVVTRETVGKHPRQASPPTRKRI